MTNSTLILGDVGKKRVHFAYLDGLRGFAALYVVFYHVTMDYYRFDMPQSRRWLLSWLQHGGWAVDVFIVLSGYCLMLPSLREKKLRGGIANFIKRRATRIMPPYYAILIITLVISSTSIINMRWIGNDYGLRNIVFHIMLIHNWNIDYALGIDPVLWSVASEWQIYFVFCFLLFPVWKKFGNISLLVASFFIGYAPLLFTDEHSLGWCRPWYVALFAFGMIAASTGKKEWSQYQLKIINWSWIFLAVLVFILDGLGYSHYYFIDPFVGASTALMIFSISRLSLDGANSILLRFFSSKLCVFIGSFSYSLYLTHYAVLLKCDGVFRRLDPTPDARLAISILILVPVSIIFSYLFYIVFEKPFIAKMRSN